MVFKRQGKERKWLAQNMLGLDFAVITKLTTSCFVEILPDAGNIPLSSILLLAKGAAMIEATVTAMEGFVIEWDNEMDTYHAQMGDFQKYTPI